MIVNNLDSLAMSATITVSVRIPLKQAKVIKRAAKAQGIKLATFMREQSYIRAEMVLENTPSQPTWEQIIGKGKANA